MTTTCRLSTKKRIPTACRTVKHYNESTFERLYLDVKSTALEMAKLTFKI
jgi:hypothetical protein